MNSFDLPNDIKLGMIAASERIEMMLGDQPTIVVSISDPDKGINGEYRVVRSGDGVMHIVHLEDSLYTSHFIISRTALYEMTERLVSFFWP